jgi:hypothetical protein
MMIRCGGFSNSPGTLISGFILHSSRIVVVNDAGSCGCCLIAW